MPQKEEIASTTVEYEGHFDFGRLYQLLHDLFTSYDYYIYETKYLRDDVDESIKIQWDCFKFLDDYTKVDFSMEILYVAFGEGEVQKGGRRVKMETGDIEVNLKVSLVTDYKSEWEDNMILKHFKGFYEAYLYKDTFDTYDDDTEEELWEIAGELKDFFRLQ